MKPLPRENRGAGGDGRARSAGCHHLTMGRQQTKVTPGAASTHVPSEATWPERRRTRLGCRQSEGVGRTGGSAPRSTAATLRRVRTAARLEVSHHQPHGGRGHTRGATAAGRSARADGEAAARGPWAHHRRGRDQAVPSRSQGRGRRGSQRQRTVREEARRGRAGGPGVKTPGRGGPAHACRQAGRRAAEERTEAAEPPTRRGREGGGGSELETVALLWGSSAQRCARASGRDSPPRETRGGGPAREAGASGLEGGRAGVPGTWAQASAEPGGALGASARSVP